MSMTSVLNKVWKSLSRQKAVLAILALVTLMLFFDTNFFTPYNWLDMLRSTSIIEIIGFGVTVVVICGACDLSVGGTMSIGGILAIMLVNANYPFWLAFLAGILSGALVGLVNGFLVVHQKTEPFIITLGMGMLLKGVAQQLTNASPLSSRNMEFMKISNQQFFGIPSLVVYMAVLLVAFFCLLRFTGYGRNCYAIGGNYEVAKNSGINVIRTKWIAFVISGSTAALAGVLLASRMNTGSSIYGDTTGMLVNCGIVIGGTSFAGGIGGIYESFIGLFVIQLISNSMGMLGIGGYSQQLIRGIIIVLIIGMDCYARKRKREAV